MTTIVCAISGIEYRVEHFPHTINDRSESHPILSLPTKKLLSFIPRWVDGKLTPVESKLLFLGLMNSTGAIEFRAQALPSESTVALNMERLAKIVNWVDTVKLPSITIPHYAVTKDNCDLSNIRYWIDSWYECRTEFESGRVMRSDLDRQIDREAALQRMINSPSRSPAIYARILADWADSAVSFPKFAVSVNGTNLQCNEYWKEIIRNCGRTDYQIWKIELNDLKEIVDYLEDNLEHGTQFSTSLLRLMYDAVAKHENFLGLDISDSPYKIIDETSTTEQANIQALIIKAPDTLPTPEQYPSRVAYLRAKIAWDMAQKGKGTNNG